MPILALSQFLFNKALPLAISNNTKLYNTKICLVVKFLIILYEISTTSKIMGIAVDKDSLLRQATLHLRDSLKRIEEAVGTRSLHCQLTWFEVPEWLFRFSPPVKLQPPQLIWNNHWAIVNQIMSKSQESIAGLKEPANKTSWTLVPKQTTFWRELRRTMRDQFTLWTHPATKIWPTQKPRVFWNTGKISLHVTHLRFISSSRCCLLKGESEENDSKIWSVLDINWEFGLKLERVRSKQVIQASGSLSFPWVYKEIVVSDSAPSKIWSHVWARDATQAKNFQVKVWMSNLTLPQYLTAKVVDPESQTFLLPAATQALDTVQVRWWEFAVFLTYGQVGVGSWSDD